MLQEHRRQRLCEELFSYTTYISLLGFSRCAYNYPTHLASRCWRYSGGLSAGARNTGSDGLFGRRLLTVPRQFSIFFFSAAIWMMSLLTPFRLTRVVKSSPLNGY